MDLKVSRNILLGNRNTYLREGRGEKSFTSTFLLEKKNWYTNSIGVSKLNGTFSENI